MTTQKGQCLLCLVILFLVTGSAAMPSSPLHAQTKAAPQAMAKLEQSFREFLSEYRGEMKRRNEAYLKSIHPKLPNNMYDFFFDITRQMTRYSEAQNLEPKIECQEFNICKAVYRQPNDSWAAQRFILHRNRWRWLDQ